MASKRYYRRNSIYESTVYFYRLELSSIPALHSYSGIISQAMAYAQYRSCGLEELT